VAGYYRDVPEMKAKDAAGFEAKVAAGREARNLYETTGELQTIPAVLPPDSGDAAMTMASTYAYYGPGGRKEVPNYSNKFAVMSREHFLQFDVQSAAPKLDGTPFLQLHGPNAIAPALAARFFEAVPGDKKAKVELDSPDQTTIYDDATIVEQCATAIAAFFADYGV